MIEAESSDYYVKKAFEVSYAIFRISGSMDRGTLAECLMEKAVGLLDSAIRNEYSAMRKSILAIKYLVQLGNAVNMIHPQNADSILHETNDLYVAIADTEDAASSRKVNLDGVFSRTAYQYRMRQKQKGTRNTLAASGEKLTKNETLSEESLQGDKDGFLLQSKQMRQAAIIEVIRQSGNLPDGTVGCRLKTIMLAFPDLSERTIRYDLQNLIDRGVVDRIGGGAMSFYKIKEDSNPVTVFLPERIHGEESEKL